MISGGGVASVGNDLNELRFRPVFVCNQALYVQKFSTFAKTAPNVLCVVGGVEKRIVPDMTLMEREMMIPYAPRTNLQYTGVDFAKFYTLPAHEDEINYMRYCQKEITEISLINCTNIFHFFVNFLAQSNIADLAKLRQIYEKLKEEFAYPDMNLNLRKINLEEFYMEADLS